MTELPAIAGGTPVRKQYLIFGNPLIEQPEIEDVIDSLESGWLGTGPKVKRFEDAFRDYIGTTQAIAVNSCTAALHLSLLTIGVLPGDEVITTPMTFTATAASIIHAGATPVFVDVDLKSMNMSPDMIESAITERTKAILPVHFAGFPCDMDRILALSRRFGLKIVEDAAHAVESVAHGRKVGNIGDLTCFSFYSTKNIVTGEGGMITTNDKDYMKNIKMLALHGMTTDAWHRFKDKGFKHYQVVHPGFKYNMMDLQAAIGYHQLQRIEKYAARRKEIWNRYNDVFKEYPFITPSDPPMEGDRHARHLYTLLLKSEELKIDRDRFMEALHKENIGTGVHYVALHLHPFYGEKYQLTRGAFPNAEYISDRTLSLPLSPKLSDADVEDVITAVCRIADYYAQ
ncbi:MAG: DegT/DnrJ/EryC1/StrS family aminotransferase [Deltaproteobacteria bacterium]|nr:DegT/DnrJ/EryC1/StrS family aminotransferase [Deltaproteobacteria bacterium]